MAPLRARFPPLLIVAAIVWAVAVSIPGCKDKEREPGTLRMNLSTEPPSLDWSIATDNTSIRVLNNIMEGLTRFNYQLRPQPALAESWEVSDGGLTYTFHLREGVKWTDGKELVARHFVDGWRRLLEPETASEYSYFLYIVEGAKAYNTGKIKDFSRVGVKATGRCELRVTLERPVVYFPAIVSFMSTFPIRADVIDKHGNSWTEPENIVTLGPYKLKEWEHEYRLELARNENYYGETPSIERVEMFMVEEENVSLDLYHTGVLDMVGIPPYALPHFKGRDDHRSSPAFNIFYLGFNVNKPPFDNVLVRRAFAHAVNREQVTNALGGGRKPWKGWIPPGMPLANKGIGLEFNPEKVRELLRRAAYESPDDLPPITLGYNSNRPNRIVAENIQAQWRSNPGVAVEISNMEWKAYLAKLKQDPPQVFRLGWGADYPDPNNFMKVFTSDSGNNNTGWGNAEYDDLVARAASLRDEEKRQKLYDRAQEILLEEDCVIIPVFVGEYHYLVSPKLKGFQPNPMELMFLDKMKLAGEDEAR